MQLTAKAAIRFDEAEQLTIVAGPASTVSVHGVRLRNHVCWATEDHSEGASTFVGGFVAEAAGEFGTKDEAVSVLANLANPYFQVMALIANAAIEEPEDLFAYAPPVDPDDTGEFVVQRHSQARAPAARLRKVSAPDAMAVVQSLMGHPREERLHRAMAHYRMALDQLNPENRVLSAESLWMAVENMSRVVFDRLCSEHAIDPTARDAKHLLALVLGFPPKKLEEDLTPAVHALIVTGELDPGRLKRDNTHLDALDTHIRRDLLLGGDRPCYKQLREMSDGFEHGYMSFGDVRAKSAVADAAFTHLRHAILREIGIEGSSSLFDARYDTPQGVWRPAFEGHGEYTDSSGRKVDLSPETFNDPWPDAPGLSLVPMMNAVVDNPDGTRTITLEVNGTTTSMPDTQTARVTESRWISPGGADSQVISREITTRLNGEIVEDSTTISEESPADDPTRD
ncbi:MAG: hypothetical protein ACT452_19135 [Microthrixaceae bacterium]